MCFRINFDEFFFCLCKFDLKVLGVNAIVHFQLKMEEGGVNKHTYYTEKGPLECR